MKTLLTLLFAVIMMTGFSCVVVSPNGQRTSGTEKGKKKGWYKNRHNPHNPNTDNPGKGKKHFSLPDFK